MKYILINYVDANVICKPMVGNKVACKLFLILTFLISLTTRKHEKGGFTLGTLIFLAQLLPRDTYAENVIKKSQG